MGNFQGGGNRGGGRDFRGGGGGFQKKTWGGGDREGRDRAVVMHRATCGECGKACEVPFKPTGEKPVFCNDCFHGHKEGGERNARPSFNDRAPRREFNDRAPRQDFAPRQAAPVADDFLKKQLSEVNNKLDRLVMAIEKMTQAKTVVAPAVVSKGVEAPKVAVKAVKKVAKKAAPKKKK